MPALEARLVIMEGSLVTQDGGRRVEITPEDLMSFLVTKKKTNISPETLAPLLPEIDAVKVSLSSPSAKKVLEEARKLTQTQNEPRKKSTHPNSVDSKTKGAATIGREKDGETPIEVLHVKNILAKDNFKEDLKRISADEKGLEESFIIGQMVNTTSKEELVSTAQAERKIWNKTDLMGEFKLAKPNNNPHLVEKRVTELSLQDGSVSINPSNLVTGTRGEVSELDNSEKIETEKKETYQKLNLTVKESDINQVVKELSSARVEPGALETADTHNSEAENKEETMRVRPAHEAEMCQASSVSIRKVNQYEQTRPLDDQLSSPHAAQSAGGGSKSDSGSSPLNLVLGTLTLLGGGLVINQFMGTSSNDKEPERDCNIARGLTETEEPEKRDISITNYTSEIEVASSSTPEIVSDLEDKEIKV